MAPVSRLCNAKGNEVMALEEADLSRLEEAGWTMPETFTFKAADGITDLYGNMWKPFDFDPAKRYPIIAEVYPGPQMEGVSHSFSASNARQQLAQIGFIVVQLGHRVAYLYEFEQSKMTGFLAAGSGHRRPVRGARNGRRKARECAHKPVNPPNVGWI